MAKDDTDLLEGFDESENFLRGLEEPKYRRRRRGAGAVSGAISIIVTSPSILTTNDGVAIGTVVGTVSVVGGFGSYTFTLTDPSNQFTIVGNQIKTTALLTAGHYDVTIHGTNGVGDNPVLVTTIFVSRVGGPTPTYYIYGF
jgi:hypothetical protein